MGVKMRIILLIGSVLFSTGATAKSVWLECPVKVLSAPQRYINRTLTITLNEEEETAGFVMAESGWSVQKSPAQFSPNQVKWSFPDGIAQMTVSIDRTTLRLVANNGLGRDWYGQCTIGEPNSDRKF
jgi:hypothetical protein